MAFKRIHTDDVLAYVKKDGTIVVADSTQRVTLPAEVSPTGRREIVDLDVSEAGRKELQKLLSTVNSRVKDAYKPLLELIEHADKTPKVKTSQPKPATAPNPAAQTVPSSGPKPGQSN